MTASSHPYLAMLFYIPYGFMNFDGTYPVKAALFTSAYTPDGAADVVYSNIRGDGHEVAEQTGVTGGYVQGGLTLNTSITPALTPPQTQMLCPPVTWTNLTATFRYVIIYQNKGAGQEYLMGYLDFGVDQTVTASAFTLQFPDNIMMVIS